MHCVVEKPDCNWAAANALQGHGEGGPSPSGSPSSPSPTRSLPLPPPHRSPTDREKQQHGDRRPSGAQGRASHSHTAALGSAVGPGYPLPSVSEPVLGS